MHSVYGAPAVGTHHGIRRLLVFSAVFVVMYTLYALSTLAGEVDDPPYLFRTKVGGPDGKLRFLVVGDWGSDPEEEEMRANQLLVARGMRNVASALQPHFVLSAGDQAYPHGLPRDREMAEQRMAASFESVYDSEALHVPWFATLGNHDCEGHAERLISYAEHSERLRMPRTYYKRLVEMPSGGSLLLLVLDACTLVCGAGGGDDGDGGANHRCGGVKNGGAAARREQLAWLEASLAAAARDEAVAFKVVMAHWPVFSFAGNGPTEELIEDVLPLLEAHGVDAWFNGHDHNLQHLQRRGGSLDFFVSGAGGYDIHGHLKEAAPSHLNAQAELRHKHAALGFLSVEADRRGFAVRFHDAEAAAKGSGRSAGTVYRYHKAARAAEQDVM